MIDHLQQLVVGDDDQRVDLFTQAGDAGLRLGRAALALEREGPGDHTDGQRAQRAGDPGHDGGATGTRAATFAGGHEDHVGALQGVLDVLGVILGGLSALVRVGPGAEAAGQLAADVELDVGVAHQQRLGVGVDGDEFDPPKAGFDHPVDGIDAATTNPDDLDDRQVIL